MDDAHPGREQAAASLAAADEAAGRMRRKSSWYAVYCAVFGTVIPACTLTLGLSASVDMLIPVMAVMGATIVALVSYTAVRPVTAPWFNRVHNLVMGSWGVLYTATILIGMLLFKAEPAWWVPMSVATALPFAVAAVWVLRTSRGDR
ncbi:hypothetical protein [Nocardiopsis halophila]|uniref:hypothetical protein n=1 Tax=Nocardiopsis halophila TaxID=141692 RepID=UPI0003481CCE|nr:hypothetical protein [Nocardiopsis halophila]